MKWVVFATAPDQIAAEMWQDILRQAGFHCELRPGDTSGYLGLMPYPVRLVAPEVEAAGAKAELERFLSQSQDGEEPD